MTVTTTFIALLPILWATGAGADVMRRIAAPMVGGIITSFIGELVVYPALYFIWRSASLRSAPLFSSDCDTDTDNETEPNLSGS
jgi:Cu(I)/Ag(I) efflux system membrane protein CusA/SilA